MRVLVLLNNFPWQRSINGIFNWMQLRALRELGHEIRIVRWVPWSPPLGKRWSRYRGIPNEYVHDDFPVRTLRVLIGPRHYGIGIMRYQSHAAISREIASFAPDIVQVHGLIPAGVMALNSSVPYVLTGHGTETYKAPFVRERLQSLAREIVTHAAACVGVSAFVAERLRNFGASEPRVIFNGADETIFYPRNRAAARAELGLDPLAPTVMYAGHMLEQKGLRELAQAAVALRDLRPQFIFAGEGVLAGELRDTLQAAGIHALFPGLVKHEMLATMYAAADVVTLPSYAEGLPLVLCEALSCGRAVVATRVGGIPEIVQDGESGYLIEPRDPNALTLRLRDLLSDEIVRKRFEHAALAFAREHLTWKANARAYDALYHQLA
jgi:teichuronic acid biosynthesis glycosyltransferase TuaC